MERGNSKHSPREDDMLAAELDGQLGPGGSNREEWDDPEPPADDDAPGRVDLPAEGGTAADEEARYDMDVANDWHRPD